MQGGGSGIFLGSVYATFALDTAGLTEGVAKVKTQLGVLESSTKNSVEGLGNSISGVGKNIGNVAGTLMPFSLAAGAVLGYATKAAMTFDQTMELLHTQAGDTQQQVQQLAPMVKDLAGKVGFDPSSLANALYHVASVGNGIWSVSKQMNILQLAAEGAKVGQADLNDTTYALTSTMSTMISGAETATSTMGLLNAVVGAGDMHMQDLNGAISTGFLSSAKVFGLSLQSVGASLATLTDNGMPAEAAANRLRMSFSLMAAPSKAATKYFDAIGLSSLQLGEDLRKPNGMGAALADLKQHLEKTFGPESTQQLQTYSQILQQKGAAAADAYAKSAGGAANALARMFGGGQSDAAILTLLTNTDRLNVKYQEIGANAGKFSQDWAAQQQQSAQKMADFKAQLDVLAVDLGNAFLPTLENLAKSLEGVVTAFDHLSPGMKQFIVDSLAVVAISAPILKMVSSFMGLTGMIVSGIGKLGSMLGIVGKVGGAVGEIGGAAEGAVASSGLGKMIGDFIEGIFKPLASPTVLRGAASAAVIGIAITTIAFGINMASKAAVNFGNLLKLLGALVIVTAVFSLLSFVAEFAIPGAVTGALVGLALWVTAIGISKASDASKNISEVNLLKLSGAIATVSVILAAILPFAAFGAIGAILSAVIGGGLVLAAEGLKKASDSASTINRKGLKDLFDVIKMLGNLNAGGLINDLLNLVKTSALAGTAMMIRDTSETLNQVKDVKATVFENIKKIFQSLDNLKFGSIWHDWGDLLGSGALAGTAKNIVNISNSLNQVKDVKSAVFSNIAAIFKSLDGLKFGSIWHDWGDQLESGALAGTAKNIVGISVSLNQVKSVKSSVYTDISAIFKSLDNIKFGSLWHDWGDQIGSGALEATAKNIVSISKDLNNVQSVNKKKISDMTEMIKSAASIDFGKGGIGGFLNLWGKSQDSGQLYGSVKNILAISKDLNAIQPVDKKKMDDIKAMIAEAGTIKFNVTQVTSQNLGAMLNQGVALATNFVKGVQQLFGMAYNAGHDLQSRIWKGIQDHFSDEWQQGAELVRQVANGMNANGGNVMNAGHNIQSKFWSAIQSHMGDEYSQGWWLAQQVVNGLNNNGGNGAYGAGHNVQSSFWRGIQDQFGAEYSQGWWLAQNAVNGIYGNIGAFWSAGDAAASGFAGGIRRNIWQAQQAASSMGSAAAGSIRAALGIHSPSRVMHQIGLFMGQGLVNGLLATQSLVMRASGSLSKSMTSSLSGVSNLLTASPGQGVQSMKNAGQGGVQVHIHGDVNNSNEVSMDNYNRNLAYNILKAQRGFAV